VAYVIGDHSEATFRRLLRKIPREYLKCPSYSDYWKSYRILLSKGNHQQVGKESGKTNHIERWNATLRARISRCVRKAFLSPENSSTTWSPNSLLSITIRPASTPFE
jgi:IS1 family transposase